VKEKKYRRALVTAHTFSNGCAIPKTVIQLNGCGVPVDLSNTSLPYLDIRANFGEYDGNIWVSYNIERENLMQIRLQIGEKTYLLHNVSISIRHR